MESTNIKLKKGANMPAKKTHIPINPDEMVLKTAEDWKTEEVESNDFIQSTPGDSNKHRKKLQQTPAQILKKQQKEAILNYVSKGLNYSDACKLTGVGYRTFVYWQQTDKDFVKDLHSALVAFKITHVENIARIAVENNQWQASKFLLQSKFKEEYGDHIYNKVEAVGQKEDSFAAKILAQLLPQTPKDKEKEEEDMQSAPKPVLPGDPFAWEHASGFDDDDDQGDDFLDEEVFEGEDEDEDEDR